MFWDADSPQCFFVFCSFQAYLHMKARRGGAISLS
jgi:hypothetical protein